jgi:hypothetical protein
MVKRIRLTLLVAALALLLPDRYTFAQTAAPAAVSASYDVQLNGLQIAVINEQFDTDRDTYRIVSESIPVGLLALLRKRGVTLVSSGKITSNGLRPDHFEGTNGDDDARRVSAEFDWTEARLTLKHEGQMETAPLPPGTQDRISLMYQFMFVEPGQLRQIDVAMTNGRKIDRYRYSITPGVDLDTPLGRMKTLHLVKAREPGESAAEIWLAPQHHFFPVKVLLVEKDGARYEQTITRLDFSKRP